MIQYLAQFLSLFHVLVSILNEGALGFLDISAGGFSIGWREGTEIAQVHFDLLVARAGADKVAVVRGNGIFCDVHMKDFKKNLVEVDCN